jgi:hypothetical protein
MTPPNGGDRCLSSTIERRGPTVSDLTNSPPNPGAAGAATAPSSISLSVEEYQRLRTLERQVDDLRQMQQAALESKETERLRMMAEKGQIEEALGQQRKAWEQKHAEALSRYAQLEQQVHAERKSAAIAEALQGRAFLGETAEQRGATAAMVRRLLEDEFETTRDTSGALVVREKVSGRPAVEALRQRLESPEFAIFFAPASRGGAGSDGTRLPAGPGPHKPGSLESIVAEWRNKQAQYQSFGLHPRG